MHVGNIYSKHSYNVPFHQLNSFLIHSQRGHLVMQDGGLEFHMSKDLSETILMMRKELDGLLSRKVCTYILFEPCLIE